MAHRVLDNPEGEPRRDERQADRRPAHRDRRQPSGQHISEGKQRPVPQVQWVADLADPYDWPGGQKVPVQPRARPRGNDADGPQRRQNCPPAWKGTISTDEGKPEGQQQESDNRDCLGETAANPLPPHRSLTNGEQPAEQQFPRTRSRRKERQHPVAAHLVDTQRQRGQDQHPDRDRHRPKTGQHQQQDRPDQVELLFDRERPQMQQDLLFGRRVEVAALRKQDQIRGEAGTSGHMLAQFQVFVGQQQEPASPEAGAQHQQQRRKDPADPPVVEPGEAEPATREVGPDDRGDQVSGDDEKDIDPDETTRECGRKGMEADHHQHGEGAKPIDVRAIGDRSNRNIRSTRVLAGRERQAIHKPVT